MKRYHATTEGNVPYTPAEETARDLEEAQAVADKAEEAKTQYQRDREAEYPQMEDYLDAIVKGDTAQVDQYIADCLAVKAKYPKPT
tara:strand:- start:285 stop:542 length:258 start_codon:yes stop_codon:yes gene_type:complete